MLYYKKILKLCLLPICIIPIVSFITFVSTMIAESFSSAMFFMRAEDIYLKIFPLFLSVCLSFSLSKKRDGSVVISGVITYLVLTNILLPTNLNEALKYTNLKADLACMYIRNPLFGVICGILSAKVFDRFSGVKLPQSIAFFSGKRLVPIMSTFYTMLISIPIYFLWSILFRLLMNFNTFLYSFNELGISISKTFNAFLLSIGLENIADDLYIFEGMEKGIQSMSTYIIPCGILYLIWYFLKIKKRKECLMMILLFVSVICSKETMTISFLLLLFAPKLWVIHCIQIGFITYLHYLNIMPALFINLIGILIYLTAFHLYFRKNEIQDIVYFEHKKIFDNDVVVRLIEVMGGIENIKDISYIKKQLIIQIYDLEFVDEDTMPLLGYYQYGMKGDGYHIEVGGNAYYLTQELLKLKYEEMQSMIL